MWLGLIFLDNHPRLQIPRVKPDCRRPWTRLQAPRRMTARGLPPGPEGAVLSRRPPRSPGLPPPTPGHGAPPPSPTSTSSPLGPSSRASHHSVSSYLRVSLPFVFIFTFHAAWGAEGRAEYASGRMHRYAFLCTPRRARRGRSQSPSIAPGPPHKPTNPARRRGRSRRGPTRHPPAAAPTSARRLLPAPPRPRARAPSPASRLPPPAGKAELRRGPGWRRRRAPKRARTRTRTRAFLGLRGQVGVPEESGLLRVAHYQRTFPAVT